MKLVRVLAMVLGCICGLFGAYVLFAVIVAGSYPHEEEIVWWEIPFAAAFIYLGVTLFSWGDRKPN